MPVSPPSRQKIDMQKKHLSIYLKVLVAIVFDNSSARNWSAP
jgi:hypothetical protein